MASWNCQQCMFCNGPNAKACLICGSMSTAIKNTNDTETAQQEQQTVIDRHENKHDEDQTREPLHILDTNPPPDPVGDNEDEVEPSLFEPDSLLILDESDSELADEYKEDAPPLLYRQSTTFRSLQSAASDIACFNHDALPIFNSLYTFTHHLLSSPSDHINIADEPNHSNGRMTQQLLCLDGVLTFLLVLGYQPDATGSTLICHHEPSPDVLHDALDVISRYQFRLDTDTMLKPDGRNDEETQNEQMAKPELANIRADELEQKQDESTMLSLEQLIIWCTHENTHDSHTDELMDALILMHKEYTTSLSLLRQLRRRCDVDNLPYHENKQLHLKTHKIIQLKILRCLTDWLHRFWDADFSNDIAMQQELESWLVELDNISFIDKWKHCVWIQPLLQPIKSEYLRHQTCTSPEAQLEEEYAVDAQTGIPRYLESVEITVLKKNYKLTHYKAHVWADQLTLMHFKAFERVSSRECIGQKWKKDAHKHEAPHICEMIQQFNALTNFVQLNILWQESVNDRSKMIRYFIAMGRRFKKLRNYFALNAVIAALNSTPIQRLKDAWQPLPDRDKKVFESFKEVFSSKGNFKNYRTLFRHVEPPAIPNFALFLQDLVFIEEGNDKYLASELGVKTINFSRCTRMMDRIKTMKAYQSKSYEEMGVCKANKQLQKLLYSQLHVLKDFVEDEIWNTSDTAKRADSNETKRRRSSFLSLDAITQVLWSQRN